MAVVHWLRLSTSSAEAMQTGYAAAVGERDHRSLHLDALAGGEPHRERELGNPERGPAPPHHRCSVDVRGPEQRAAMPARLRRDFCGGFMNATPGSLCRITCICWVLPKTPLPQMMRWLKGSTARWANQQLGRTGEPFWQDESFDRIVRDSAEFEEKLSYIYNNSFKRWPQLESYEWLWWPDKDGVP